MGSDSNARNAIPSQSCSLKGKCLIISARKVSERLCEALRGFTLRLRTLKRQPIHPSLRTFIQHDLSENIRSHHE